MNPVFLAHFISCIFMAGIIWLVQILVYPLFQKVGPMEFKSVHDFHVQRITWIVAPVMLVEIVTAFILWVQRDEVFFLWNLSSVVILWILTAFVNVPTHNDLSFTYFSSKQRLVVRNWPRTIIWTLRAVVLSLVLVSETFGGVI